MGNETADELRARVESILPDIGGPVIAWDLDSTICNTEHRRHVSDAVRAEQATWDDYAMLCSDDEPIEGSVALMCILAKHGYANVAISGRSECALDKTWAWMLRHGVPLNAVLLRRDGDHRPNGDYKVAVLRELQHQGVDVQLFLEDWGKVAEQVRQETGIPVVGINPFDTEELANLGSQ